MMSGVPSEWQKELSALLEKYRAWVFQQGVKGVLKDPKTQKIWSLKKQSEILCPVTTPALLYPALYGVRPRKRDFLCPTCGSTNRTHVMSVLLKSDGEKTYRFLCRWCDKKWDVGSKLILNDILEDQVKRIASFTKKTKKEFGALVMKTNRGIVLDLIQIGEGHSISMAPTRKLMKDEEILGTWHAHPISDQPSFFDLATFLKDDWEKISCVSGAEGSLTVMIKTEETVLLKNPEEVKEWEKEKLKEEPSLEKIAEEHKFLVYRGNPGTLRQIGGAEEKTTTLEKLVQGVKGVKRL